MISERIQPLLVLPPLLVFFTNKEIDHSSGAFVSVLHQQRNISCFKRLCWCSSPTKIQTTCASQYTYRVSCSPICLVGEEHQQGQGFQTA